MTKTKALIPSLFLALFLLVSCAKQESSVSKIAQFRSPLNSDVLQITKSAESVSIHSNVAALNGLQLNRNGECYSGGTEVRLCVSETVLSIREGNRSHLFLRTRDDGENEEKEEVRAYSIGELLQLTQKKNFTYSNEFMRLKAAKANMKMHYLNLLPHFTNNSLLALATFNGPLGLLSVIGDLAPFLLPSRWFRAEESGHLYEAEKIGMNIANEDALALVEGMAIGVARDQKVLTQLDILRGKNKEVFEFLLGLENTGKINKGRSRNAESTLALLDQTYSGLKYLSLSQRAELSYAVGFYNPEAIQNVTDDRYLSIDPRIHFKADEIREAAIENSKELQQMAKIIDAAKANAKSRIFEWLDPSADSNAGLGLAYPTYIELGKISVEQLEVQQDYLNAEIQKKVVQAKFELEGAAAAFELANRNSQIQIARIDSALQELKLSPNDTPIGELQDALSQLPPQQINTLNAEYGWRVNLNKIQRFIRAAE